MRRVVFLILLGVLFFILGFLLTHKFFPTPQVVLPVKLVSLNHFWIGAFSCPFKGQGLDSLMSNTHLMWQVVDEVNLDDSLGY